MTNPTLRQLIEGAQKPVTPTMTNGEHFAANITRRAAANELRLRFTPEVALAVLEALETTITGFDKLPEFHEARYAGSLNINGLRKALQLLNGQAQPSPAP